MHPIYTMRVISPMPYIQTNSSFHPCISPLTAQSHIVNVSSPSIYSIIMQHLHLVASTMDQAFGRTLRDSHGPFCSSHSHNTT